ncbi:hypothetical protein [Amycolatopsis sp. cmx-4-68]|uniref:hypothetical protein n=1 Tax=Amycolatopsis sp. cmx-4-68 TaxID=2790938 RepID=UPI0039790E58
MLALQEPGPALRIRVQDTGPPDADTPPEPPVEEGHGVAWMRERAALYGGTVTVGPTSGG